MDKEHILREIKRTAEESGGKPLGRNRFEAETGIKAYDWQKYWIRWSDALREVGCGPNKFRAAFKDDELLGKLAQLARQLGHVPVHGELVMKRHHDRGFPDEHAFRRFRGKPELVRRLREHCLISGEYDDVVQMCETYTAPGKTIPAETIDEAAQIGFVYLMKSGRFYKIGHSDAPGRRHYDLAIQLPEHVELIHKIPTEAPKAAERFWHERFKAKRKGGEWFALSAADVKAFRRCRSM